MPRVGFSYQRPGQFIFATFVLIALVDVSMAVKKPYKGTSGKKTRATARSSAAKKDASQVALFGCDSTRVLSFYPGAGNDRAVLRYAREHAGALPEGDFCRQEFVQGSIGVDSSSKSISNECAATSARSAEFTVAFERLLILADNMPVAAGNAAAEQGIFAAELGGVELALRTLAMVADSSVPASVLGGTIGSAGGARMPDESILPERCVHPPSCAILGLIADARHVHDWLGLFSAAAGPLTLVEQASAWTSLAADGGDGGAMANFATLIEAGRGPGSFVSAAGAVQQIIDWRQKAAEAGDCGGAFQLGAMLVKGGGDPAPWWRRAAAGGHLSALYHLAALVEASGNPSTGLGALPPSLYSSNISDSDTSNESDGGIGGIGGGGGDGSASGVALDLYVAAASRGHVLSMHAAAVAYHQGLGVAASALDAVRWLTTAAVDHGHGPSAFTLGLLFEAGEAPLPKPVAAHLKSMRTKEAKAPPPRSNRHRGGDDDGEAYTDNDAMALALANAAEAGRWYAVGASLGHAPSMAHLGVLFDDGGLPPPPPSSPFLSLGTGAVGAVEGATGEVVPGAVEVVGWGSPGFVAWWGLHEAKAEAAGRAEACRWFALAASTAQQTAAAPATGKKKGAGESHGKGEGESDRAAEYDDLGLPEGWRKRCTD